MTNPVDSQRHEGSGAIVTGAAAGIGYATARRLAGEGARVTACDINLAGLEQLKHEIENAGAVVQIVRADITESRDVDRVVEAAVGAGSVDVLANVAGVMDQFVPLAAMTDDEWDRVLAVNLTGPMRLCRRVLPLMLEARRGAIVNMASRAGIRGGGAGAAYVTSKHGLVGLTASIAATYASDGIRCNAVCPGGVATEIGASAAPREPEYLERWTAMMRTAVRFAEPDEIAAVVSWLASDEASNLNGSVIAADSGWTTM